MLIPPVFVGVMKYVHNAQICAVMGSRLLGKIEGKRLQNPTLATSPYNFIAQAITTNLQHRRQPTYWLHVCDKAG